MDSDSHFKICNFITLQIALMLIKYYIWHGDNIGKKLQDTQTFLIEKITEHSWWFRENNISWLRLNQTTSLCLQQRMKAKNRWLDSTSKVLLSSNCLYIFGSSMYNVMLTDTGAYYIMSHIFQVSRAGACASVLRTVTPPTVTTSRGLQTATFLLWKSNSSTGG